MLSLAEVEKVQLVSRMEMIMIMAWLETKIMINMDVMMMVMTMMMTAAKGARG